MLALVSLQRDLGMINEARRLIAILRQIKSVDHESLIAFDDNILVFDWFAGESRILRGKLKMLQLL